MTPITSGTPPNPSGRPCLADGAPDGGAAALRTLVSVPTRRDAGGGTTRQPRRSHLRVSAQARPAVPAAVPSLRHHARDVLAGWGVPQTARETTEQLVSELAANAVRASAGIRYATVGLNLAWYPDGILIKVSDASAIMPDRKASPDDAESGRGLLLVERLSLSWGAYPTGRGKVVWCIVGRSGTD
jgi:anti-sigma regulatory factor (Ser/Thr protein kinase)